MKNKLFICTSIIVVALIFIPAAMAADKGSDYYFQQLVTGITKLFQTNPDTKAFITGVMNSFPLIAVFIIVLGIVQYISAKVIFRDAQSEKYATLLGIGMALIAVWNQAVFNWIVGLGTTSIMIIFVTVILGLFYEALSANKTGLTHLSAASTGLNQQRVAEIEALKEKTKASNAYNMEAMTEQREIAEINSAMNSINSLNTDYANVGRGLQAVGTVLARLAGPSGSSVSETINLVENISRSLAAVGITVKTESRQFKDLDNHVTRLQREVVTEENTDSETIAINRMNAILSNMHLQVDDAGRDRFVNKYKDALNDMNKREVNYFKEIAALKQNMESENEMLRNIINEQLIPEISASQYPQALQTLRAAIQQNQKVVALSQQANIHLNNLRTEENRQRAIELQVAGILAKEKITRIAGAHL